MEFTSIYLSMYPPTHHPSTPNPSHPPHHRLLSRLYSCNSNSRSSCGMPVLVRRVVWLLVFLFLLFFIFRAWPPLWSVEGVGHSLHLGRCALCSRAGGSYSVVFVVWGLPSGRCSVLCSLRFHFRRVCRLGYRAIHLLQRLRLRCSSLRMISLCGSGRAFFGSLIHLIIYYIA
jgi:hypothetical protein